LNLPVPKEIPYQISMDSGQWFMRKRFLKVVAKKNYIKLCPLRA